ncbi:RDD family protein [Planococcus salinarum]|uniref:RDD family protein n=1 Tax=Planococcus salinarum TaxID=622695 RepID=UPI000E3D8C98|nr:RDD family protein [Planococcus salinarum]TAA69749.1 RDD family protein [Planococcus salinarum]
MNRLMKKRMKAMAVDTAVTMGITVLLEPLVRNKLKNKAVYDAVAPSLIFWGLEYAQMRVGGQTIGHKAAGIVIDTTDGSELTSTQILKRLVHRDTVSTISYLRDRQKYDFYEGTKLPHDLYADTVVKEYLK